MSTSLESPREKLSSGRCARPMVHANDVPLLVKNLFGLTTVSVKEMSSYDDRNFCIKTDSEINNPYITELCPHGYVFKILNSQDSQNEKIVVAQNQMMLFLHSHGFNVPKPERNVHGTHWILQKIYISTNGFVENNVDEQQSVEYIVRLLTFIPGKTFYQITGTAELYYETGVYTAKIDNALKGFHNEALKSRKFLWFLENVPAISSMLYVVKDEKFKMMIQEILESWNSSVIPVLKNLEKGVIHGDFNDQNIIVNATTDDPTTYHVDGLIDFGDIGYSYYVLELAITISYNMIEVKTMSPIDVGGYTLAGYQTQGKISEAEFNILKECVAARIAQSLVIGAYSYEKEQENKYLVATAVKGWDVLNTFWNTPKEEILSCWRKIAKNYKH
ncbi:hydroxylysine kinase isoform X2 [Panulirus ornatus]